MKKTQNGRTLRKCHCRIARCIVAILAAGALVFNIVIMANTKRRAIANDDVAAIGIDIESIVTEPLQPTTEPVYQEEPSRSCTLEEVDSNPWVTPIGSKYQVSKNDFVQLCNLVGREYGADFVPIEEKAKVVQTVLNRVESPYFPDSIEDVITQPGQYEGELSRGYYSDRVTESVRQAVLYALNGNVQNDYVFYWGDGVKNHFYSYEEYECFVQDLNNFKAANL